MSNPLGDLISGGEGGYDSFNRGRAGDARGMTIDFSKMKLAEIQAAQHLARHDPNRLFAIGKYQIIPGTMDKAIEYLHLDPNQKFTSELQEHIFADYLISRKRPAIESYIREDAGATLHSAQKAAAMEWASVDDPDTPGTPYKAYVGIGNNRSNIRSGQIADALNTMRAEYQADIARGMKPDEAWKAVTRSTVPHEQAAHHHASRPHAAREHHVLEQGVRGEAVHDMQAQLAGLGYLDAKGVDGNFGIGTRHAVERFQHDHHLSVDGKVGPLTQQAIREAPHPHTATRALTDPKNPDHALFEQALACVRTLNAHGHPTELQQLNLAATLVVEAKRESFTRIDQVALGNAGSRVYIAQHPTSPMEQTRLGSVDTASAMRTPMAHSSELAAATPSPSVASPSPIAQTPTVVQTLSL